MQRILTQNSCYISIKKKDASVIWFHSKFIFLVLKNVSCNN